MSRDLSFLEIKPDDSAEMRGLKSYWVMVMAMPEAERKVFFQQERVKEEQAQLDTMVAENMMSDQFYNDAVSMARNLISEYEDTGDESIIEIAEEYVELAKLRKADRYSIGDIRKQRERVQWEQKKLREMQHSDEQQPSSET